MKQFYLLLVFLSSWCYSQNPLFIPDTLSGTNIDLTIQSGETSLFSGTPTQTMGINGNFLAPTVILNKWQNVSLNVNNTLQDTTTIHWHGLHVSPENDGGPHTPILPGQTWNPEFQVLDWASTYWYHPHLHHKTNEHVQKGISGFLIVRDSAERNLELPRSYGIDDFPLAIQTKAFTTDNQIITMTTALDSMLMVNGTLDPYLDVPAQVIRLRLLNGSSERVFNLGLSNGQAFFQIGSDGGLLSSAVNSSRLQLAPGERAEILVNCSGLENQTIYLRSFNSELANGIYGAAQPGMGAGQTIPNYSQNPLNGSDFDILELRVIAQTSNPVITIPSQLITHTPWTQGSQDFSRTITFSPVNMGPTAIQGPFVFDMMPFDMMMINQYVQLNDIEIWTLQNNTPIAHPFHIHDVQFYILDINGVPPSPDLAGRKDVILVPGGMGTVRFITKFEDFSNDTLPYMYHCHMLTHEDDGMMGQFIVQSQNSSLSENDLSDDIHIYPNPFKEDFTISPNDLLKTEIFSSQGELLFSGKELSGKELNNYPNGCYILHLISADRSVSLKIVKQ
ncbi:MAG: multicopper oxidase domain-containing protein [Cryomorphaceae bacterium]|jgi:bilirubin oxidase|nr:multicopper oxidase domain-containing protein [Cryomorphaceae bacterium]